MVGRQVAKRPYDAAVADPFADLMAKVDTAMIVVTTASGDIRAGCLAGFHSQCSIDPPRYAVWLSKANHTYRVALLAEHFGVHFLTTDDRDIAERFGSLSGDDTDKFSGLEWEPGDGGVPLLARPRLLRSRAVGGPRSRCVFPDALRKCRRHRGWTLGRGTPARSMTPRVASRRPMCDIESYI